MHFAGGMEWTCPVGENLARIAVRARKACGESHSWSEIIVMAEFANRLVQDVAFQISNVYELEKIGENMSPDKLIRTHGPADLLTFWAADDLSDDPWLDSNIEAPYQFERAEVLAAFALLMVDHAAAELVESYPIAASEFLAIAGIALANATMDLAKRKTLLEQFKVTSEAGKIAASSRWKHLGSHKMQALDMANSGEFKGITEAARSISSNLVKSTTEGVQQFYEVDTVIRWLRDLKWQATGADGSHGPHSLASSPAGK
jgi:hypothetical protein